MLVKLLSIYFKENDGKLEDMSKANWTWKTEYTIGCEMSFLSAWACSRARKHIVGVSSFMPVINGCGDWGQLLVSLFSCGPHSFFLIFIENGFFSQKYFLNTACNLSPLLLAPSTFPRSIAPQFPPQIGAGLQQTPVKQGKAWHSKTKQKLSHRAGYGTAIGEKESQGQTKKSGIYLLPLSGVPEENQAKSHNI